MSDTGEWRYKRERAAKKRRARRRAARLVLMLAILLILTTAMLARRDRTPEPEAAPEPTAEPARDEAAEESTMHLTAPDWEELMVSAVMRGDEAAGREAAENGRLPYTYDDLYLLAKIIEKEAGHEWPDAPILAVADVVLNRRDSADFPDTIRGVIYQPNQYEPVYWTGWEEFQPSERYVRLAQRAMKGESAVGGDVIFQALFPQGSVTVMTYYDEVLGTTTYWCKE